MNRILIFIFTALLLFSCKTAKTIKNFGFTQLDISQHRTFISSGDSIQTNEAPVVNFTASNDSTTVTNINYPEPKHYNYTKNRLIHKRFLVDVEKSLKNEKQPNKEPSKSIGIRIFIPFIMLMLSIFTLFNYPVIGLGIIGITFSVLIFLLLHTNIFRLSKGDKKGKSKRWQILVSIIALMACIAFVILAQTDILALIGIVFVAIALMVLILAIINNLTRTQPKPEISKEEKRKAPYNKWAILAGISLLIFLISMVVAYLIFVPYISILILFSFIAAFTFSIIALVNMSKKSYYEQGKALSKVVLIISSIPFVFILSFVGYILADLG